MDIPLIVVLNGLFPDQRGKARRGKITGYNGNYEPCRRYTWIDPEDPELKGKHFEAFDSQIRHALVGKNGERNEDP